MALKDYSEVDFIRDLQKRFAPRGGNSRIIKGIGDDTSVTTQDGGCLQLATTDSLVEGQHFSLDYFDAYLLGRKALAVSLSDIASMGGVARFLLVSLNLPERVTRSFIDNLYAGLDSSMKEHNVTLIGGNTTGAKYDIIITTTVLGEVSAQELVTREGASVGESIFVTGILGASALGLKILTGEKDKKLDINGIAVERHLNPAPRLKAGRRFAQLKIPSAMIDISDGLMLDLKRLCEQSRVGAVLELEQIPVFAGLKENLPLALCGGEDYELLFTVTDKKRETLEKIRDELDIALTCIGRITAERDGVVVLDSDGKALNLPADGYMHF